MGAWLKRQPRSLSVALAARVALRVLPVYGATDVSVRDLVLPVFRAAAVSWAAAKYPAHKKELAACAAAADSAVSRLRLASGLDAPIGTMHQHLAAPFWAIAASIAAAEATFTRAAFAARAAWAAKAAADAADAADAFWTAVSIDATRLELGVTASDLAGSRLWPQSQGQPDRLRSLWHEMEATLNAAGQDWQVWTDWYRDRLEGRPNDENQELTYVQIDEALWKEGPAVVNAVIRTRIEKLESPQDVVQLKALGQAVATARAGTLNTAPLGTVALNQASLAVDSAHSSPTIPPKRPAALEPVWSGGKLVLPPKPARTSGDIKALSAALKVLRAEIIELADDAQSEPSNFDKRIVPYLRRIGERIPNLRPSQEELFRLGHMKEFLEAYSKTASDEWPNHLARRFHALAIHFDRTVRQFPRWREFVRNAQQDRLTAEQATEVPAITEAMVKALRDEDAAEFIDPVIAQALENLQAPDGESAIPHLNT